mmetsp:Transcript_22278/g.36881  ORF Transcript_22278/g.36881 Transcript_22278/m.36881 type:complete len:88 (+) Transcript_22278:3-266(+)
MNNHGGARVGAGRRSLLSGQAKQSGCITSFSGTAHVVEQVTDNDNAMDEAAAQQLYLIGHQQRRKRELLGKLEKKQQERRRQNENEL